MGILLALAVCASAAWLGLETTQEQELRARFSVAPAEVEVGQPFVLRLELEHPSSLSVFDLKLNPLELDDSWVLFDADRETAQELEQQPARSVTRWHWNLASLDSGERRLLNELISLISDERVKAVDASQTSIHVLSVLGEEEDEPRPLRGLPSGFGAFDPQGAGLWQRIWPGVLAFLVLSGALAIWRLRGRQRAVQAPSPPAPLAELEELRATPARAQQGLRARHFALTQLVRRATDEKRGPGRSGLTDEEWLAEIEADLGARAGSPGAGLGTLCSDLRNYLQAAEAIKYANLSPSDWALEETYESTRQILETLRQGSWPEPPVKLEQEQRVQ